MAQNQQDKGESIQMVEKKELGRGGNIDKGKEVDRSKACSEGNEKSLALFIFIQNKQVCY